MASYDFYLAAQQGIVAALQEYDRETVNATYYLRGICGELADCILKLKEEIADLQERIDKIESAQATDNISCVEFGDA